MVKESEIFNQYTITSLTPHKIHIVCNNDTRNIIEFDIVISGTDIIIYHLQLKYVRVSNRTQLSGNIIAAIKFVYNVGIENKVATVSKMYSIAIIMKHIYSYYFGSAPYKDTGQ